MMKQHALRVPCWLSAGPWRLARGGRTWIVRQSNAMWHGDALAVFVSHFRLPGELCDPRLGIRVQRKSPVYKCLQIPPLPP